MSAPKLRLYKGRYYIFYSIGRRSLRKTTGTAKRDAAKAFLDRWLQLGGHLKPTETEEPAQTLPVSELWELYDKGHVCKNVAAPGSIYSCWKNLKPYFGKKLVDEIDAEAVLDYEQKRLSGTIGQKSQSVTVRKELIALRACFNWNASPKRGRGRALTKARLPVFDLPEGNGPRERWLTHGEIQALFAAAHEPGANRMSRAERFLWLALETAARKRAILDLTWDRVDFDANVIHYAKPGRRATTKRRPSVPISRALRPVLLRAKEEAIGPLVLDSGSEVWGTIQRLVVKSGIGARERPGTRTGVSPHTLRHTAATHMARNGVSLWKIAKILGNSTTMVEQVYAKWSPDDPSGTVDMISNGLNLS